MSVTVRQESRTNNTLSVTLTKNVLEFMQSKIEKGDRLLQWSDPTTKTVYIRKLN
jgi:hypothetical protein